MLKNSVSVTLFLSTLSLRRATPVAASTFDVSERISIHALLAESDNKRPIFFWQTEQFLSTLSLRRATFKILVESQRYNDFYPRSPCGERQLANARNSPSNQISIHALLAESDWAVFLSCNYPLISIHALLAESDNIRQIQKIENGISIHALLAESDEVSGDTWTRGSNFYPRSPCGERHGPFLCL